MNSLVIVLFLSGMVAMIMLKTLHKDIARYNQMDQVHSNFYLDNRRNEWLRNITTVPCVNRADAPTYAQTVRTHFQLIYCFCFLDYVNPNAQVQTDR